MASRFASLRNTLQKTTQSVVTDGAKVAEYRGPSVGSGTNGNYGTLPRPIPMSYFFTQEYNLKWFLSMVGAGVVLSSFIPIWSIPMYRKTSKDLKRVSEEFGPTRYGAGKKFFI